MRFAIYIYGNFVGHADLDPDGSVLFDPESAGAVGRMKRVRDCVRTMKIMADENREHEPVGPIELLRL